MARNQFLYGVYERQLAAGLDRSRVPRHVGVILDGNRRWAKAFGSTAADGHRRGADKILEFLEWSRDAGVEIVTLWLLSVENLQRDPDELADLCAIIADAVDQVATLDFCEVNLVGSRDSLPAELRGRLQAAENSDEDALVVVRDDGSLLVDGSLPNDDLRELLGGVALPDGDEADYNTIAGLVIEQFGRIPHVGEHLDWAGWRIEVVDLDGARIDKLLLQELPEDEDDETSA